jgi:ABC-type oligopeptide transport system ATPase subunit
MKPAKTKAKSKTPPSTKNAIASGIRVIGRTLEEDGGDIVVAYERAGRTMHSRYAITDLLRSTVILAKDLVKMDHVQLARGQPLRETADLILEHGSKSKTVVLAATGLAKIVIDGKEYWIYVWDGRQFPFGPKPPVPVVALKRPGRPSRAGNLREWKKAIRRLCRNNPNLIVALCHALAAALRRPFREVFLVLLLIGPSSTGKSTIQRLVAALYGSPENEVGVLQMNGTEIGIRMQLEQRNDQPVCFQDIRQSAAAEALFRLIFSAADGANRYKQGGGHQPMSGTPLLSNERGMMDLSHRGPDDLDEGLFGRCVELYADAEHGMFHDIHGAKSAKDFAEAVEEAAYNHHGMVWPEWLQLLSGHWDEVVAWHKARLPTVRNKIVAALDTNHVSPVDARMLDALAFSAWVGMVASELKLLPIPRTEIREAFASVVAEHMGRRRAGSTPLSEKIIAEIRGYIDQHQGRFPPIEHFDKTDSRSGLTGYRRKAKDGTEYFLFFPEKFDELFVSKHGRLVFQVLKRAGFLRSSKGRGGNQLQVRISSLSGTDDRKSFIAIKAAIRFDSA